MIRLSWILLAAALAVPVAPAQEEDSPDEKAAETQVRPAPTAEALLGATEADRWYGIYAHALNVGSTHLILERPEEGGIRIRTEFAYPEGSGERTHREVFEMTPEGGLRLYEGEREDVLQRIAFRYEPAEDGGIAWRVERSVKRPGGEAEGPPIEPVVEEGKIESPPSGAVPFFAIPFALARMDWAEGQSYSFQVLPPAGQGNVLQLDVSPVGVEGLTHRGEVVESLKLQARVAEGEEGYVFHLADGDVVEITGTTEPLRFVLGTEDQARANLEMSESEGEQGIKEQALEFLLAAVTADEAALDETADLEALQRSLEEQVPAGPKRTPEEFRAELLERLEAQAGQTSVEEVKTRLEAVLPAFRAEVEGPTASLYGPGDALILRFEEKDGAWRVVWWNQLPGIFQ